MAGGDEVPRVGRGRNVPHLPWRVVVTRVIQLSELLVQFKQVHLRRFVVSLLNKTSYVTIYTFDYIYIFDKSTTDISLIKYGKETRTCIDPLRGPLLETEYNSAIQ